MLVGIKDAAKLIGIIIISCCAVLVCTLFLNYYQDIQMIKEQITSEPMMKLYNAQLSTAKVICLTAGGCMLATSIVMLFFYIKHYVDTHKKELGILKALGYSNFKVAKGFWVFGLSVFVGTLLGFGGSFLLMPKFYEFQNKDKLLPEVTLQFHPMLFVFMVLLPTAVFAALSVLYAVFKLKKPVLQLLKNDFGMYTKAGKHKADKESDAPFLTDLKKTTLKSKKVLVFFIVFSALCFSANSQMSFAIRDWTSEMMSFMLCGIGLVVAFTTLFIAITTVVHGNTKTIAMMRAFGYSQKECCSAVLGIYRPVAYIGFALGTAYQYGLLRLMIDIVFKDMDGVPEYKFDVPIMLVSLAVFVVVYEIIMYVYAEKIKKISIKEIMLE